MRDAVVFNKSSLLKIFEYINERLKENQLQLDITVYGGSIMTLVYDNRPATRDIDCIFGNTDEKLLEQILDDTGFVFSLPKGWINEDIKEPLQSILKEDKETYRNYSNLRLLKPKAEQLLAMKILSARPEPSKDFIDAHILCKELKMDTREKLLKLISDYIPLSLIGERQIVFIRYLGEDLGYDWK